MLQLQGELNLDMAIQSLTNAYRAISPVPSALPLDHSAVSNSPAEGEPENIHSTKWAVSIGNAPPPLWSIKRKANDEGEDADAEKRSRLTEYVSDCPSLFSV